MKVVSGDQLRFVTYPHPKSTMEDTSKEIRHYGDSDACIERLVMSIPNHVQGVAPHEQGKKSDFERLSQDGTLANPL